MQGLSEREQFLIGLQESIDNGTYNVSAGEIAEVLAKPLMVLIDMVEEETLNVELNESEFLQEQDYNGVTTIHRSNGLKYRAKLKFNGREFCLGFYTNPYDAAQAYDKKAYELLGKRARLNFPDDFPQE